MIRLLMATHSNGQAILFYPSDFLWPPYGIGQAIIFFSLWFLLSFFFFFFSWPPCVADADIIFLSCFFLLSFFFPRLISAVADWMSTILPYTVWP